MTPADLSRTVARAVRGAVEDGELPAGAAVSGRVVVERTRPGGVGEYATAVAFQVAKAARCAPGEVARVLARRLGGEPGIESVEVTGAGFLNFTLPPLSARLVISDAIVWDVVIRDVRGGAAFLPAAAVEAGAGLGLRERVVQECVLRLVRSQGGGEHDAPLIGASSGGRTALGASSVAPVAKRDGDVVARFGADAARWAMLAAPPHETPSFPGRLLVQDESSEFFRVRYGYARTRALLRNAARLGFRPEPGDVAGADALLRALADHPLALEAAAHHRAPERLVRQLVRLADTLLDFQYDVLPKGDEKPSAAHRARLALAEAAGTVLAGGLSLLGIAAPERL
ncbi:ArgS-related anticodon-binding protein NrtL [Streptomyces sp. NPDC054838]